MVQACKACWKTEQEVFTCMVDAFEGKETKQGQEQVSSLVFEQMAIVGHIFVL